MPSTQREYLVYLKQWFLTCELWLLRWRWGMEGVERPFYRGHISKSCIPDICIRIHNNSKILVMKSWLGVPARLSTNSQNSSSRQMWQGPCHQAVLLFSRCLSLLSLCLDSLSHPHNKSLVREIFVACLNPDKVLMLPNPNNHSRFKGPD